MQTVSTPIKITLLLIAMTTMMSNVAIVTALPILKETFGSVAHIELLSRLMITLPSLVIALFSPFLGHLIHHNGKKRSAIAALILFSIAGSAGLYLQSMESLLASRAVLGIAIAALMIISTSLIGDYFQGEARHKFMGMQSAFISLGGMLFVVGGGILADISWRYAFGIYLIGVILIPFVIAFLDEKRAEELNAYHNLNTNLLGIYALAFLLMLIFYSLPTQMPFLMINHFGASSKLAGAIIACAFIANGLGAMTFAKIKPRFSFEMIYLIGMGIVSIGFILIGLVHRIELFFFTAPIMGFGGGILMTNVTAWMLSKTDPAKRVKSSGYLTSSLFLGQFASPIVFYPLVHAFGVQHFFIIVGVLIGVGVSLVFVFQREKYLK